ncbi:hypothetical protein J2TS6_01040 [Paenibacillus albilobatus]|uniref:Uncharacterized protein n=1 Tax=Paenibacillus albilobatus TaxID=2716884 RepID=A0A920C8Q1_9BACL|nr:hypothetical protein J2TS6_01040 [Paenibacillus albilobatus]
MAEGEIYIFQNEILVSIATKYNKSVAQVILRWKTPREIVATRNWYFLSVMACRITTPFQNAFKKRWVLFLPVKTADQCRQLLHGHLLNYSSPLVMNHDLSNL